MLKKESAIEKISGSLSTEFSTTFLATISSSTIPVAAFLPTLSNSLASQRFKKRVEEAFEDIKLILQAHENKIVQLGDAQFKLINECALAILQTTDQKKLNYLKSVIKNAILTDEDDLNDGVFLSRAIRDISAAEANFLIKNFKYSTIKIGDEENGLDTDCLLIQNSEDKLICSGLISLGLLIQNSEMFWNHGVYNFSGLVAKLIVLLHD